MSPETLLVLGCFGLGLLITYAVWCSVRGAVLQADLWEIVTELDSAMIARGEADNAGYLANRAFMTAVIEHAPSLSLPVGVLASHLNARTYQGASAPQRVMPRIAPTGDIPQEVAEAYGKLIARLLIHWMLSPSDVAVIIGLLISSRTGNVVSRLMTFWQESVVLEPLPRQGVPPKTA